MGKTISQTCRRRLNVQGWSDVDDEALAATAPWHRMAFLLCALLAGTGTALASPLILWVLAPIAAAGAIFPFHPFDLIYNHGIRHLRKTGPLPRRRAQTRFACGVGATWVAATAIAFQTGAFVAGYVLGGALAAVALLVGTTDICIPSMIYNAVFLRQSRQ